MISLIKKKKKRNTGTDSQIPGRGVQYFSVWGILILSCQNFAQQVANVSKHKGCKNKSKVSKIHLLLHLKLQIYQRSLDLD